jgi:hypothetical protein
VSKSLFLPVIFFIILILVLIYHSMQTDKGMTGFVQRRLLWNTGYLCYG